jgi:hypothetical protein
MSVLPAGKFVALLPLEIAARVKFHQFAILCNAHGKDEASILEFDGIEYQFLPGAFNSVFPNDIAARVHAENVLIALAVGHGCGEPVD